MDVAGTVLSVAQTLLAALQCSELKEVLSIVGYKSQLEGLKDTVESINSVLCDAETKQELSQQDQNLIEKLKDAVFEADDLLDEFVTLAEQKQLLKTDGSLSKKVSNFFSSSQNPLSLAYRMSRGVKDIKKKLDAIAFNKQFSFKIDPEPIRKRSRETCSYVSEAEIIGREHDLEYIVGTLLDSNDRKTIVSVLSIVGIGGLGKTALAQLVYNDLRVTNAFPLKMWTCVSDQDQKDLDVKEILGKILGGNPHGFALEQVKSQLQENLAGKRYLLVLDDLWTEKRHQWCELVKYLIGNKMGSWILVTTRSQNTATISGGQIHELSGLSEENSWHLFEKTAFALHQSIPLDDELIRIGRKIADGCAGVPLAIRVAGSLLYGQDKNKWRNIQNLGLTNIRDVNTGIAPILELSFHHLESPLKNCFRYCAVFPKDYVINKEVLIRLWMAQGYIVPLDIGQSIDDAGEDYFSILLKRCFFQDIKKNEDGEIKSFKIHDLMHDIAQKVSGKEIYALNTISGNVDKKVRHLSILNMSQFEKNYSFGNAHIRSLISFNKGGYSLDALLKNFKWLRVLDLCDNNIKCLPDSVGELLHLRYIDLSWNAEMEALPKSITKLCNLQTLILYNCIWLKELPKDLGRLTKLSVLDITYCLKLMWMPRGLDRMTCLHTLKGLYVMGGKGGCKSWRQWFDGLEDLKYLINLKGRLQIGMYWPEKNAKNDAEKDRLREGLYLKSLKHVDNLELRFFNSGVMEDEVVSMRVMENLRPHSNLKRLYAMGYDCVKMPGWLTLLPHLVELELQRCELNCLPCLGNLCHLKSLHLKDLPKLEYIIIEEDSTVLASTSAEKVSFYPSLEKLNLDHLPKFKGWRRGSYLEESSNNSKITQVLLQLSFSQLKELPIFRCEEFTCTLLCPMLETLELRNFNEGMQIECTKTNDEKSSEIAIENPGSSHHVPKMREVKLSNGAWLDSISMESFQSLQTLQIQWDCEMEELPRCLQYLSALQTLQICYCQNLKAMPNWMPKLTSLKHLKIVKCSKSLKIRCRKDPPGEDWGYIKHIPKIYIF